jgi:hypothetical protein
VDLTGDLDQMLTRSRELLRTMQAARPDEDAPAPEAVSEAAGGLVRVVAVNQRLTSLELDPRVMRMASVELAEAVLAAVNGALDATRPAAGEVVPMDPRQLAEEVAKIQDQGVRQMAAITDAISAAIAQVKQATQG